jgi:DivIVA domain-containing protein
VLTLLGYGALAIVVAAALFFAASYLLPAGEQIAPPVRDEPLWDLPAGRRLSSDDVAGVRLPVALRGYRFAETDSLLDRLADELQDRDEEIERLRGQAKRPDPQVTAGRHAAAEPHPANADPGLPGEDRDR